MTKIAMKDENRKPRCFTQTEEEMASSATKVAYASFGDLQPG